MSVTIECLPGRVGLDSVSLRKEGVGEKGTLMASECGGRQMGRRKGEATNGVSQRHWWTKTRNVRKWSGMEGRPHLEGQELEETLLLRLRGEVDIRRTHPQCRELFALTKGETISNRTTKCHQQLLNPFLHPVHNPTSCDIHILKKFPNPLPVPTSCTLSITVPIQFPEPIPTSSTPSIS